MEGETFLVPLVFMLCRLPLSPADGLLGSVSFRVLFFSHHYHSQLFGLLDRPGSSCFGNPTLIDDLYEGVSEPTLASTDDFPYLHWRDGTLLFGNGEGVKIALTFKGQIPDGAAIIAL